MAIGPPRPVRGHRFGLNAADRTANPPPGFTPPTPQRDVFETMRGPAAGPQRPTDYNRERGDKSTTPILGATAGSIRLAPRLATHRLRGRAIGQLGCRLCRCAKIRRLQSRSRRQLHPTRATKAQQAEANRVRDKYGYYTPDLATQDRAG